MILTDVNNKSSYFHSSGVGNTILLGYESAKHLMYQTQRKNKNSYYLSFKIRLGNQLETRHESRVELIVDSGQLKDKKISIIVLSWGQLGVRSGYVLGGST